MVLGLFGKKQYARLDKRMYEPVLHLTIDNETYDTLDWSLGGCRLGNYSGPLRKGDKGKISELTPGFGTKVTVLVYFSVVRYSRIKKQLTLRFDDLGTAGTGVLEGVMHQRSAPKTFGRKS